MFKKGEVMNANDIVLNLISFGAYGKVKKASSKYADIFTEYVASRRTHENHIRELGEALGRLAAEKRSALVEAKKNREVSGRLDTDDMDLGEKEIVAEDYSLTRINETMRGGEVALSVFPGIAAGAGAAFAVWVLVERFGKMMETSIAVFTGMDRVNAVLMWLGGGAFPGRVGNRAIGALVVAAVFLIPMLLVSSGIFRFFAVRKILKTEAAIATAENIIVQIKEDLPHLESVKKQAEDMTQAVLASKQVFLEWHEVCCMSEAQRKEKLITLAASMLKILGTPPDQVAPEADPEIPPA